MRVYFDNAATTNIDERVVEAMIPYLKEMFGNPSSIHSYGRETRTAIENARKIIAEVLKVSPSEIFFTSGGTEANNHALNCSVRDLGVTTIISSKIEHHCIGYTMDALEKYQGVTLKYVNLLDKGIIDYDHLEELLKETEGKYLVSLMHANNEIGNLLNLKKVSALCEEHGAYFHTDTVQTIGHYYFDLQKTKIHFISGSAHKFHGPKGTGFLYINPEIKIGPLIYGVTQERNMRAGTENIYGIVGLGKAVELSYTDLTKEQEYVQGLKTRMIEKLKSEITGVGFNGDYDGKSNFRVLNVSLPKHKASEMFLMNLDIAGIACSAGSACTSGADAGSHVLEYIGADMKRPAIRFSFSRFNTSEEIDFVVDKLKELYVGEMVA